jgi:Tat protein translocase TatB subunit
MFNMTGSEVMFLLIIGLVVLGPEKLPDAIRRMGRLYAELKRMSSGVQTDLRKVMDEPLKEMMNTTNTVKSLFTETATQFQSASKEIVEPSFIPYQPSDATTAEPTDAQDSDETLYAQSLAQDEAEIAAGIAASARIAQERTDEMAKQGEVKILETVADEHAVVSVAQGSQKAKSKKPPAKKPAKKVPKKSTKKSVAKKIRPMKSKG